MEELATGYGLIEGPLWDADRGLFFTDVQNGGIHLLARNGDISTVLPKRRGVGGLALHEDGGLIFGGRDISYSDLKGAGSTLLTPDAAMPGAIGFNDLTTDARGRIFVGSLAYVVFGGGNQLYPNSVYADNFTYSTAAVPLPAGGLLLLGALGLLGFGRRRRA